MRRLSLAAIFAKGGGLLEETIGENPTVYLSGDNL
jgi:hypothetical protein